MGFRAGSSSLLFTFFVVAVAVRGVEVAPVIWTGLGSNANWTTSANWQGNLAPVNDGTGDIRFGAAARSHVVVNASQNVKSLTFDFTTRYYYNYYDHSYMFSGNAGATLTLGSGGITATSTYPGTTTGFASTAGTGYYGYNLVLFESSLGIVLGSDQTWTTGYGNSLNALGRISGAGKLTLSGGGSVYLGGANTYTGGTVLNGGSLVLGSNSALGSGPLTVSSTTFLYDSGTSLTLPNALNLNANLYVFDSAFAFAGPVTLGENAVISVAGRSTVSLTGAIGETGAPRMFVADGPGAVILSGANTYSGGTASYGARVFFRNATSIPATGLLQSSYGGYIGIGFNTGVQSGFINKFSTLQTFGTIGFDTDPGAAGITTFTEPVDLTGFTLYARLGSATRATLSSTATITPAGGTGYRFGGGGGTLKLESKLTGVNAVTVESLPRAELTLNLTYPGNDYSGHTSATHSAIVFGAGAMPAGSATGPFKLGAGGYIGAIEPNDTLVAPSAFISRFDPATLTGVIGFDSANPASPRTIGGPDAPINLSQFTTAGTSIALGTSSAAIIAGAITLPPGQTDYHFTGYKGGWLTVGAADANSAVLSGARAVRIGDPNEYYPSFDPADATRMSTVFLNGNNTHTGGTWLHGGRLVLGHANALGGGPLYVDHNYNGPRPRLQTLLSGTPNFANPITVRADFDISGVNPFTLSGNLASGGNGGTITKFGAFNLTLAGNNIAYLGGFVINSGSITFATNTAAGTGDLILGSPGGTAIFTSAAPRISGLEGETSAARVTLESGTTLTIDQYHDTAFPGKIEGSGSVVKAGYGTLRLETASTYTGGTAITDGSVEVAATGALGTGAVSLNGYSSRLSLQSGVTLANSLTVGPNGGMLAGNGTFGSHVSIGTNSGIAPGESIGKLTFASGLTWGPGGEYDVQVLNASGPAGVGFDSIHVNGTLAFTSTFSTPFNIYLSSISAGGVDGNASNFVPSNSYSWPIVTTTGGITGFNPAHVYFDSSYFANPLGGGTFSLALSGNNLLVNFTPVPEPSTWALLIAGLGLIAVTALRRRK